MSPLAAIHLAIRWQQQNVDYFRSALGCEPGHPGIELALLRLAQRIAESCFKESAG